MMKSRMISAALAAGLVLVAALVHAQAPRPGRLSKEEQAALRPGLRLGLFAANDAEFKQPLDARTVRLAALHVPGKESPTAFVAPGAFRATLDGYLKTPLKGEYRLHVHVNGTAVIELNGETLDLKTRTPATIALAKGYNRLNVRYSSAPHGDSQFRMNWSGDDFIEEPLPPDALFTRGDETALVAGLALRHGRELFATRGCLQCHSIKSDEKIVMAELAAEAPSLIGVGSRLNDAWLRAWVADPKSMRPTATMPKVLHGTAAEQSQQAADIAAYLGSLTNGKAAPKSTEFSDELTAEGLKHFENLGCVACHSTKPLTEADPFARRSLHFAKAKFAPGQLATFLRAPQKHYAWSKMPDFRLSEAEANALAAFVQSRGTGSLYPPKNPPSGDATRGKKLFTSVGCASCHRVDSSSKPEASARTSLTNTTRGCLADSHDKSPDFGFSKEQRDALMSFLATDRASLARDTAAEFAQRQVQSLNCLACHRRDGSNSVLINVLQDEGEQGLTPEILPTLTWTGEKLKPAWSEKLIAGELDQRARPWLKARMPAWPTRAILLAVGLSHEHGFAVEEDERPKPDPELAKVGEQLVGDQGGFSCIKCHAIGKRPPLTPFEAPGINLVSAAERLRYSYYPRWMLDPPRVDISTKMPKFAADGKTTTINGVLDGQAAKQYEALWHYIQTLK